MSQAQSALQSKLMGAGLSNADASSIVAQAQNRQIAPQSVQGWVSDLQSLVSKGLPASLMSNLLQEGLVKNIPVPRINSALQTLTHNLSWVKSVLQSHSALPTGRNSGLNTRVFSQFEDALRSGAQRNDLASLLGSNNLKPAQAGLLAQLLGDLSSRGLSSTQSTSLLQQANVSKMHEKQLNKLQQRLDTGLSGKQATPGLVQSLLGGLSSTAMPNASQEVAGVALTSGLRNLLGGGVAAPVTNLVQGTLNVALNGVVGSLLNSTVGGLLGTTSLAAGAGQGQAGLLQTPLLKGVTQPVLGVAQPLLGTVLKPLGALGILPKSLSDPNNIVLPLLGKL